MTTCSKRTAHRAMLALAIALVAASPARAQHEGHQTPPSTATTVSPELMNVCVTAQRQGAALADRAQARLEAARQTNNAADMRAAVDELQSVLGQIRTELQACDPVAAAAAAPAKADPHAGHQTGTAAPGTMAPGTPPVMQPGGTTPAPGAAAGAVDHSKMGHGTPAARPEPAAKPRPAEVDHSKMGHGAAPKPATAASAKPAPASKAAAGGEGPKLPVTQAERVIDPACPNIDTKTAPTATYQKKVYYFCSTRDRDEFVKDPAAYLKKRPR